MVQGLGNGGLGVKQGLCRDEHAPPRNPSTTPPPPPPPNP
ncbi:MAG: hypothetical protein JWP29_657, partial [Rhodoferax sp.]|nr:hypothetical protein [Rhodoferax sp.]